MGERAPGVAGADRPEQTSAAEQLAHVRAELEAARQETANLARALETSRVIGMAMGILMCRRGVLADDAFAMLRRASQLTHRKLNAIADDVVLIGDLSDSPDDANPIDRPDPPDPPDRPDQPDPPDQHDPDDEPG